MTTQLIPPDLLRKSNSILFIAHLALGDFTYLQNCFQAFTQVYPHVKIHLWVDERRRTRQSSKWEHLRKYSLYDWLAECPSIEKVYNRTFSPALYKMSIREAQQEEYPIVVSLGVLERHKYAILARKISPHGFVVGQKSRVRPYDIPKLLVYRKLDAYIPAYTRATHENCHISDIYAGWFAQMFGIQIAPALRFPFVSIPEEWMCRARAQIAAWGLSENRSGSQKYRKIVFLNSFSKSLERNWPFERLFELIWAIRQKSGWRDAGFIINVVPEELDRASEVFADHVLEHVRLFSAGENFFQLPAILGLCDLIISVETAVMHLANAVHVPVIALMRQTSPEWAPIDAANSHVITVQRREGWVNEITVEQVVAALPESQ